MTDELAKTDPQDVTLTQEAFDMIVQSGDFAKLTQTERTQYLWKFAEKLHLNPLTKPFDLIVLNGKLTVYANRTATDQLAKNHNLSIEVLERELDEKNETYTVRVKVKDPSGREEENIGAVGISNLTGEAMANAKMKAFTKAKRRAVLAFTGMGFLDVLEIESIQGNSEEAKAKGNAVTGPTVVVAAPDNPPPQVPGTPLPPTQPPTDVK